MAQPPKTYVLAGYDNNGALKDANAIYAGNPNVEVIYARPGQSIEKALKDIKGPANIIIDAHGLEEGKIEWNQGEKIDYKRLFAALPREGIQSVTISSCYGGSAEKEQILEAAPAGTVVQSQVGAHNVGDSDFITGFAKAARKGGNSTDFFVESLAVFNADQYRADAERWNNEGKYGRLDTNPEHALPHMLGIGGHPPVKVDLDVEVSRMARKQKPLNAAAWASAVKETQQKFASAATGAYVHESDKLEIDLVAKKLESGQLPQGVEEKRVAYALMAEYMDKSGDLAHRIAVARNHGQELPDQPETGLPEKIPPVRGQGQAGVSERPQQPYSLHPQVPNMPDLSSLRAEVFEKHGLVTAKHQSESETKALEEFAKVMHISGVRTDAAELSDTEIRKIQAALHVKQDGKVGEKTLGAMIRAEEAHALPTPGKGLPVDFRTREH